MTAQETVWLDPDPANSEWPRPHRLSGLARLLLVGVPVLLLVLLLTTVGLLGGFGERADTSIDTEPGTLIETGPLQLTFLSAEAYQEVDYDDQPEGWVVAISGVVRTVDDESTRLGEAFACADIEKDDLAGEVTVRLPHVGDSIVTAVQPGMAAVPFVIECVYPPEWQPGSQILVGAKRQKMMSLDPLGLNGEEGWRPSGGYYRVQLPYEVTAPREK